MTYQQADGNNGSKNRVNAQLPRNAEYCLPKQSLSVT